MALPSSDYGDLTAGGASGSWRSWRCRPEIGGGPLAAFPSNRWIHWKGSPAESVDLAHPGVPAAWPSPHGPGGRPRVRSSRELCLTNSSGLRE